jgi:hypothetical protein
MVYVSDGIGSICTSPQAPPFGLPDELDAPDITSEMEFPTRCAVSEVGARPGIFAAILIGCAYDPFWALGDI